MKKFLIEILIYCLCVLTMFGAFMTYLHRIGDDTDLYLCAYGDKINRLDSTRGSERIVLVGGSSVAFGVDSKTLGDSLGREVVNMGLHAGIGMRTPMLEIGKYLQKGDIVFYMPEYSHFFDDNFEAMLALPQLVFLYPDILTRMSPQQYYLFFKNLPAAHDQYKNDVEAIKCDVTDRWLGYRRSGFNDKGDEVSHLAYEDKSELQVNPIKGTFNEAAVDEAIAILDKWNDLGCRVMIFSPGVYEEYYKVSENKIAKVDSTFRAKCKYYYGNPAQAAYSRSKVFDTDYHLSAEGVKDNTARIIECYRKQTDNTAR